MDLKQVDQWLRRAGRILMSPRCLICTEPGAAGLDLCADCAGNLPWNRMACPRCALPTPHGDLCGQCLKRAAPITATQACFQYQFPLDRLLPRFKFHQDLASGRLLAELMVQALKTSERPAALVPVPLHVKRLRQRGYDQALELARPIARTLAIPLLDSVLLRRRDTAPQSELDAVARRRNLRSAFAVTGIIPSHVALVDDVMTTGATLHAAATALRRAGVKRIDAWVCARVA